MRIEFFIEGDPPRATAQERRITTGSRRPVFYDPDSVKVAKEILTLWLRQHRPARPLDGAVRLEVHWMFRARSHKPGWKITRPDTDNLQKLLKDIMTREGFWRDDAQVCWEIVKKSWATVPGIHIIAEEI